MGIFARTRQAVFLQKASKSGIAQYIRNQTGHDIVDARQYPRFKIETSIRIYPRNRPVVRGHTVDLSETGISAMLIEEISLGEVVRLEFTLPHGEVEVHALAQQRNAFRYGFKFVASSSGLDLIQLTCRHLAIKQSARNSKTP